MKSAQRDGVVEVGPSASSDKVSLAQEVNKQPQKAIPQWSAIDFAGDQQASWRLVTSYHKHNRYLVGGHVKPSSRKVNHRFNKRTTVPLTRGQNNTQVSDLGVDSTAPLALQATPVLLSGLHATVMDFTALPVAAALPCPTTRVTQALNSTHAGLQVALPKSADHSQRCRLRVKPVSLPPTAATATISQGGKVPFVSLWRQLYGMLFAMLLQLDLCGAAAVAAGANPPPPPPRHTLWKDPPGAGAIARGALGATPAFPEETSRLRGHKELQSVHTSHPAVLSNFQNVSTNGTDSTNTTNSIKYAWQSVYLGSYGAMACSEDGQHVVAGNYYGYLFTSNDYGATWNQSLSNLGYYFDIVSSNDGQYWAAVSHFVGIFVSSDYGQSWSLSSAAPIGWYSITSSANGQFLSAATYYDSIYTSSDFGQTWNVTSAVAANWQSIDSSESGQYLAAIASTFGLYTSSDYGVTWISSPSVGNEYTQWNTIAVSRSGQNLAVLADGAVHTSSDYGATWIVTSPSHLYWHYLVSSGSGHFIAGGNYGFLSSDDFGTTWVATQSIPSVSLYNAALSGDGLSGYGYNHEAIYRMMRQNSTTLAVPPAFPTLPTGPFTWFATSAPSTIYGTIACSHSGQFVIAGSFSGYLHTSQDYGVTWNISLPDIGFYYGVSSSSNGQYLAAVRYFGGIYTSGDYGQTWRHALTESLAWRYITSSADGLYLYATPESGSMYKSNDYGQTWHIVSAAGEAHWNSIKTSDSGKYLAATTLSSGIYTSSDYGATWSHSFPAGFLEWHDITISKSGQYLAANGGGAVFTSSDYGVSWISLPSKDFSFLSSGGTQYYIAGNHYDGVYTSDDYGATWAPSSVQHFSLSEVAISRNGQYAYGIYNGGVIYRMTRDITTLQIEPSVLPTAQPSNPPGQNGNTCSGGTYNMQPGQPTSVCAICPGGTYSTEGMTSCLSCPAGTFSTAWSSACTECPAGFYCLSGASTAVMCPSGTVSNAGASFCTACPVGQYSYPGSSTCLTCSSA